MRNKLVRADDCTAEDFKINENASIASNLSEADESNDLLIGENEGNELISVLEDHVFMSLFLYSFIIVLLLFLFVINECLSRLCIIIVKCYYYDCYYIYSLSPLEVMCKILLLLHLLLPLLC